MSKSSVHNIRTKAAVELLSLQFVEPNREVQITSHQIQPHSCGGQRGQHQTQRDVQCLRTFSKH